MQVRHGAHTGRLLTGPQPRADTEARGQGAELAAPAGNVDDGKDDDDERHDT